MRAQYGANSDGSVSVYNSGALPNRTFTEACGRAWQTNATGEPGSLAVQFPGSPAPGDYRVLEVDYDELVVVYSCGQVGPFGIAEGGWVMTRRAYAFPWTVIS